MSADGDASLLRRLGENLADLMRPGVPRERALARASYVVGAARLALRSAPRRPTIAIALVEHIGDIVAATPVLERLRAQRPRARIVWFVRAPYAELVASLPEVDEVVVVRCLTEWEWWRRSGSFDELVDLHVAGKMCPRCSMVVGRLDGRDDISADDYYDFGSLPEIYAALSGLDVGELPAPSLTIPDDVARRVDDLDLPERFVVVHGRSNQASRSWPAEKLSRLAGRLAVRHELTVVEVGLETCLDAAVAGTRSLCGRTTVLETAEVLRRAALFIGVDSGPAHLAEAVGCPGVVLLGRYNHYERYMPFAGGYADGSSGTVLAARGLPGTLSLHDVETAAAERLGAPAQTPARDAAPRVSVVVPTYGHAEWLPTTLDAVLAQAGVSFEVIVVDDGSPDDTEAALDRWHGRARIRYVRRRNGGPAAARNRGLAEARGEFVAWLDDDDVWPAETLRTLVAELDAHPDAVLAYGRYAVLAPDGSVHPDATAGPFPSGRVREAFLRRNWIHSLGQTLVRRSAVLDVGGLDPTIRGSDDWEMSIRLSQRGTFRHVDRVVLHYRVHATNASRHAVEHLRNHCRVVAKHLGRRPDRLLAHRRVAGRYFAPHLVEEASREWRAGRRAAALRALAYASALRPTAGLSLARRAVARMARRRATATRAS